MPTRYLIGDCLDKLSEVEDHSIQCCVTSPPFWGKSEYDVPPSKWKDKWVGILGQEPRFEQYCQHLLQIFGIVKQKLCENSTASLWVVVEDHQDYFLHRMMHRGWESHLVADFPSERVYCFGVPGGKTQSMVEACRNTVQSIPPWQLWNPQIGYRFGKFSEKMVESILRVSCKPGDEVLDPMGGIATLGVVAARLGLDSTLIEIDEKAEHIGRTRIMRGI